MQTMLTHEAMAEYTLGIDLAEASFDVAMAPKACPGRLWRKLPHAHVAHAARRGLRKC